MKRLKEYALYKGEEIIATGTIKEIAKELNIKEKSVHFYGTKSYQKRCKKGNNKILVCLD